LGQGTAIEAMIWSGCFSLLFSNILMIVCRGRAFAVRASHLSDKEIEFALIRQVFAPWPIVLWSPGEVCLWLRSVYATAQHYCRCKSGPAPDPRPPLSWQPSIAPFITFILAIIGISTLKYCNFFYSSSNYMWEITYSDSPGYYELLVPPPERPEDAAAALDGIDWQYLFVPQMQRYLILLVFAWIVHLCVLEPLLLLIHIFIGNQSIDDSIALSLYLLALLVWTLLAPFRVVRVILQHIGILPRREPFALIAAAPDDDYEGEDSDEVEALPEADEHWVANSQ
jgi:hypothetical protein